MFLTAKKLSIPEHNLNFCTKLGAVEEASQNISQISTATYNKVLHFGRNFIVL